MVTTRVSKQALDGLLQRCREAARNVELIYVTNLIEGDIEHYTADGLSMSSQYYYASDVSTVMGTLEALGFSVRPFYNEIDFIKWATSEPRPADGERWQMVVTTAEGGTGEGRRALIPALCNLIGLPCWNSPAHGSSVARHKFHANRILSACGIRVPRTWCFSYEHADWLNGDRPQTGRKLIIKPAWEGGSKGIDDDSVLIADGSLTEHVAKRSRSFRQSCVVQEFKTGYEVGVPIIAFPNATAVGLVGFSDGEKKRYGERPRTFADEKLNKTAGNFLFQHLPEEQETRALNSAERAFEALGMKGLGRIDMRIDEDGEGWIFDTNEAPPPLPRSSFIQSFVYLGYSYEEALAIMIGVNLVRFGKL